MYFCIPKREDGKQPVVRLPAAATRAAPQLENRCRMNDTLY